MSKRPAAPGRKGSVKVGAFKGEELADEIHQQEIAKRQAEESQKQQEDAEQAARAKEAHQAEEAAAQRQREQEAQREAEERKKAAERQRKIDEAAETERQQDLLREREKQRKEAEAEAERQAEIERENIRLEQEEKVRRLKVLKAEEEANSAAAAEEERQRELAARREKKEQARREAQAEQDRLQAIEDAKNAEIERQRKAEEAEAQRLASIAEAREQKKRELAAEQERQEAAEREKQEARERRKRELEEQRQREAQEEAERLQREQEAEEAEILRLREAEIARRRELKAQREREEQEEAEHERRAIEEENKALERERQAALERARLEAESAVAEESAELAEKRRRAEEKRRKREMFLNDMDNFSSDFQTKSALAEENRRKQEEANEALIKQSNETKKKTKDVHIEEVEVDDSKIVVGASAAYTAALNAPVKPAAAAAADEEQQQTAGPVGKHRDADKNKAALNDLSNSLFSSEYVVETTQPLAGGENEGAAAGDSDLRMPSRIGTGAAKPNKKATASATIPIEKPAEDKEPEAFVRREDSPHTAAMLASYMAASAAVSTSGKSSKSKSSPAAAGAAAGSRARSTSNSTPAEDDEDEGTGDINSISNILTKEERRAMTTAQKANWRAKQADLTMRRKDFHGVVTYTFDGIFSWQMYGSAEATDENGNPYTEYLMRCQWGTTFDNLQPWIVAHRYKEFVALDAKLKKLFPTFEKNMPSLPKKDLFRYLDNNVIAQRRTHLEEYMSKIVQSMPTLLRSEVMNEFLTVTERIANIRMKLSLANKEANRALPAANAAAAATSSSGGSSSSSNGNAVSFADEDGVVSGGKPIAPFSDNELAGNANGNKSPSSPLYDDPFGIGTTTVRTNNAPIKKQHVANTAAMDYADEDEGPDPAKILYMTADDAEVAKEEQNAQSLDEDSLGQLEEDIKALGLMLRQGNPSQNVLPKNSKFRLLLLKVTNLWPRLRATCVVGMGVDFSLIPRAMQAEEDLQRHINEFKSVEAFGKGRF